MKALGIGFTYIDVTFKAHHIPVGDEKTVADAYAVSFGGNAVTAMFTARKLGAETELLTTTSDDWHGQMFLAMASQYDVQLHHRKVERLALSGVFPNNGKRGIVRGRVLPTSGFPQFDVDGFKMLHLDGHQPDAALYYAGQCRKQGIPVSLDGGTFRPGMEHLLPLVDIAVVSEDFCKKIERTPKATLQFLREKGCRVGAVTRGAKGIEWYCEGSGDQKMDAYHVDASKIVDTNGAGDVFHGAYVFSYLRDREKSWEDHFHFAAAASAHSIQYLGIEAGLPDLATVESMLDHRPHMVRAVNA